MKLDSPLPEEGVKVPVWATFTGVRAIPFVALGSNSLSPLLRLYEDRVEFKVFRLHTRRFEEIERVHATRVLMTNLITFEWRGEKLTTGARILLPRLQLQVLVFFARQVVPLSPSARALLG